MRSVGRNPNGEIIPSEEFGDTLRVADNVAYIQNTPPTWEKV